MVREAPAGAVLIGGNGEPFDWLRPNEIHIYASTCTCTYNIQVHVRIYMYMYCMYVHVFIHVHVYNTKIQNFCGCGLLPIMEAADVV